MGEATSETPEAGGAAEPGTAAQRKKIVLFSDGTGNSAASPYKTNVWRVYKALDLSPGSGQVAFYDQGVGTSPFRPLALLGLACGFGLARNVRDIYGFLCRSYEKDARIYAFGFSRGAFTIRAVVALIASQGIIDPGEAKDEKDLERLIVRAYRSWRRESFTNSFLSFFLRWPRDKLLFAAADRLRKLKPYDPAKNRAYDRSENPSQPIAFVGVWDTVDAYGAPIDELTRAWDKVIWPLMPKDRDLSKRVARACHALALDERRESFEPMLWNEACESGAAPRILQVWFPGVHADVGGGYPDDALAHGALNWMLDESEQNDGLTYVPAERAKLRRRGDPLGPRHNSRSGFGNFYRYAPRDVEALCDAKNPGLWNWLLGFIDSAEANKNEVRILKPKIHHSVFDRIAQGGDGYAPINLPADYAVVGADGAIRDIAAAEAGQPETLRQADDRRCRQKAVWTKAWARKALYLAALAAIAAFLAYPFSQPFKGWGAGLDEMFGIFFGDLRHVLAALPGLLRMLPGAGMAEDWIARYQMQPYIFLLSLLLIGGLIYASHWFKAKLTSQMRGYFHHVTHIGDAPAGDPESCCGAFTRFLDSPFYKDRLAKSYHVFLEALAVAFLLLLILAGASRLWFAGQDGFGGVCKPIAGKVQPLTATVHLDFDPAAPCFDSGIRVKRGQPFTITLSVPAGWRDGDIRADAEGWREAPLKAYAATPLRRHLFADWYRPVAQIGESLFDRYPLTANCKPAKAQRPSEGADIRSRSVCMTVKPRRSGRLYLYLNDAVFFSPDLVPAFYKNNNCNKGCRSCPDDPVARVACCHGTLTLAPLKKGPTAKEKGS